MTQLVIICGYLGLLLFLGLFSSRLFKGTSQDYMLASHSIGPVLLLMSIFGTTMTAFALVGSTGESFVRGVGVYGMLASSSGIVHSLCFFLLGVKVWSLGKKYGYRTQIQFFRDRLESDKIGLLLFPILVGLVIPYLLIGVMASGVVINAITEGAFRAEMFAAYDYGVPPWVASMVVCGVVLVYVFFGGMRGTAWANTFQTIVFMILGVVTFFLIANKLGGFEEASKRVLATNPSKFIRGVAERDKEKYATNYKKWEAVAEYNFSVKMRDFKLTDQQVTEAETEWKDRKQKPPHWKLLAAAGYAAKNKLINLSFSDKNDARLMQDDRVAPEPRPEGWDTALLDYHAISKFPRIPGIDKTNAMQRFKDKIGHPKDFLDPTDESKGKKWSRKKAGGVYRATSWAPTPPVGTNKWKFMTYILIPLSVGMFPHLFQHWLTAKSGASFKLPVVCHPIFIMIVWVPCVLVGAWATSAMKPPELGGGLLFQPHFPANAVLPTMVQALTTPVLAGFLSAGILAAIMSSLDSQFLCIGTMFTEDIAVHYKGKENVSDRQQLVWARTFIVAIVIVTYVFSLFEPRRVFTLGVWCFSGFSSLFPLIFASLYWKRLTKLGAYACVLAAGGSWLYLFADSNFAKER